MLSSYFSCPQPAGIRLLLLLRWVPLLPLGLLLVLLWALEHGCHLKWPMNWGHCKTTDKQHQDLVCRNGTSAALLNVSGSRQAYTRCCHGVKCKQATIICIKALGSKQNCRWARPMHTLLLVEPQPVPGPQQVSQVPQNHWSREGAQEHHQLQELGPVRMRPQLERVPGHALQP